MRSYALSLQIKDIYSRPGVICVVKDELQHGMNIPQMPQIIYEHVTHGYRACLVSYTEIGTALT